MVPVNTDPGLAEVATLVNASWDCRTGYGIFLLLVRQHFLSYRATAAHADRAATGMSWTHLVQFHCSRIDLIPQFLYFCLAFQIPAMTEFRLCTGIPKNRGEFFI